MWEAASGRRLFRPMDSLDKIAQLRAMADADPADPLTFFLLGSELLHVGRYPAAAAAFDRSLSLNPTQPAAARLLGDAHRKGGDAKAAVAAYKRAIELAESTGDLQVAKEARVFLNRLGAADD
jgi:tetratricopeptide (TPR) repeat protein